MAVLPYFVLWTVLTCEYCTVLYKVTRKLFITRFRDLPAMDPASSLLRDAPINGLVDYPKVDPTDTPYQTQLPILPQKPALMDGLMQPPKPKYITCTLI